MIVEKVPLQSAAPPAASPSDFIRDLIRADLAAKRYDDVHTRFPPEPNGYLHIGHAKAILLNFGIAREFGGTCNLRYDDTNPTKEKVEYCDSILEDVAWLVHGWADDYLGLKLSGETPSLQLTPGRQDFHLPAVKASLLGATADPQVHSLTNESESAASFEPFYTSDYFEQIYAYAVELIRKGSAYVCDLSPQEMAAYRGSPDKRGKDSPFRSRPIEVNLKLFAQMREGQFSDGARTLRAKIEMASPNVWMRDPILYRIRHAEHHRTGRKWPIYPMYDFAHCLSDYIEGVTHSLCTLEFEVHRPLYDWILQELELPRAVPRQYEFARFNLSHTVMSKRKLMQLVGDGAVSGWDDPRLPTISGMRRRGVTAAVLRKFAYNIGITKYKAVTQVEALEHAIRAEFNKVAPRRFVVLRPLKVVITNYHEGATEWFQALENPEDAVARTREIPFGRTIYIEQDDFNETPPPNYFRLRLGGEIRLKHAYIIRCDKVVKDSNGSIIELRCTADLDSKTGGTGASRKMKVALHWVSAAYAVDAEIRLYDRLFTVAAPEATGDFRSVLNPHSLEVVRAKCEPSLSQSDPEFPYQFERLGYFVFDCDSAPGKLVFNQTVALKNKWKKQRHLRQSLRDPAEKEASALRHKDTVRSCAYVDSSAANSGTILRKAKENGGTSGSERPVATRSRPRLIPGTDHTLHRTESVQRSFTISGRLVRTARLREEYYHDVFDPEKLISAAKVAPNWADLLTFIQRPPDTVAKYTYHHDWEGLAALPLTSFDHWWKDQIPKETRRKIERSEKAGVTIRHVALSDDLVRGITEIYNETSVKRGKPNRHYGKNFAEVKAGMQRNSEISTFIGAYFEEELIGVMKVVFAGSLASPVTNLAMFAHRDKMTNYALMAELVRSTIKHHIPYVFYGIWKSRRQGMRAFLESNGFTELRIPRYYVPLSKIGAASLRLGIHRPLVDVIPEKLIVQLLALRSRWYAMSLGQQAQRRARDLA